MVGLKWEGFRGRVMDKHLLDQSQVCLSTRGGSSGPCVDSLARHPHSMGTNHRGREVSVAHLFIPVFEAAGLDLLLYKCQLCPTLVKPVRNRTPKKAEALGLKRYQPWLQPAHFRE